MEQSKKVESLENHSMYVGNENDFISGCLHPSIKGHILIARILNNFINTFI